MGCIAKSFKREIQEVNGYLCARNERNRRGGRFLPTDLHIWHLEANLWDASPNRFKGDIQVKS